jgi:tetratricopeptide (TPR) repeat protein
MYAKLGRHKEAIKACKQAISLKPDDATAHYALGTAYLIMGDSGNALEEYKILKELDEETANELFDQIYK